MTDKKEPLSIRFAPGCFDSFEGTQEELDALQKEIMSMLETMSPEELAARSIPLDELDLSDDEWTLLDSEETLPVTVRGDYLQ